VWLYTACLNAEGNGLRGQLSRRETKDPNDLMICYRGQRVEHTAMVEEKWHITKYITQTNTRNMPLTESHQACLRCQFLVWLLHGRRQRSSWGSHPPRNTFWSLFYRSVVSERTGRRRRWFSLQPTNVQCEPCTASVAACMESLWLRLATSTSWSSTDTET